MLVSLVPDYHGKPRGLGFSELALHLPGCSSREKWLCPPLAKTLMREGPIPHLGSAIELTVVTRAGEDRTEGMRLGEQTMPLLFAMWWLG